MQFDKGHSQTFAAGISASRLKWLFAALTLVILTGFCTVTAYADQPYINKVDVKDMGDVVQIIVSSNATIAVHSERLGERYLVFDFYGKLAPKAQKRVNIDSCGIKTIRCGWYQSAPPVARIAVGTSETKHYSVKADRAKHLTYITIRKRAAALQPAVTSNPVPGGAEKIVAKPVQVASTSPVVVAQARPEPKAPKLVSLDFVASDIHDVLKALGVQGGVNIVASPDVKGNVTVSLNKVTVEEALKLVANVSGYKYEVVEGSYVIGTAENMKALAGSSATTDEKITEVVTIAYADPAMVLKMMESQFPGLNITSNVTAGKEIKGPAVLVLAGSKSLVEPAKALAQGIEQSVAGTAQDMVSELYEVKYADINELSPILTSTIPGLRVVLGPAQGFNLQCPTAVAMGMGDTGAATGASGGVEQKVPTKILVLQGSALEVERAKQLLAQFDIALPQIVIEAKVIDISDTGAEELGIIWGDDTGLTSTTFGESNAGNQALSFGRFARTPFSIAANIKAVVDSGKGKVLANPNVLAIDGKPASAFVGDEVRYVIRVDRTESGQTTVSTETARVGVQLHTISRISPDGYITMDLHPEVSVITRWRDMPGGLVLPEVSRRYVDSTVRVKNGETIVIGGLIKDEELKSMSGVPFLKDLPFIGQLFKSRSTTKSHSEIMMFITPKLLSDSK